MSMDSHNVSTIKFPGQTSEYHGKVRDVYGVGPDLLVMVASDRISAFDVILPKGIPYKGAILNQIASYFLNASRDICPNWLIGTPAPHIAVGYRCEPIRVEMVIRGYLTGHAWREYRSGKRSLCGVTLPEGLKEHDRLAEPIITPATKAETGHDEDISREEILSRNIVSEQIYLKMEAFTRALFNRGTEMAAEKGLILVDTKYEFGMRDNDVMLMDEIHTPDSSRYFYADGYEERQKQNLGQKQLSKEFVREWLIANGFQGKDGQEVPHMSEEWVNTISDRYIELFEVLTGQRFERERAKLQAGEGEQRTIAFLDKL